MSATIVSDFALSQIVDRLSAYHGRYLEPLVLKRLVQLHGQARGHNGSDAESFFDQSRLFRNLSACCPGATQTKCTCQIRQLLKVNKFKLWFSQL